MRLLTRIPYIGSLVLLVYMPFHIFLSQSVSLLTGGLGLWKTGKDIVLFLLTMFTICLVLAKGKGGRVFNLLLLFVAVYGGLHLLLWVLHPDLYRQSAILGTVYNMRLPLFLLLGYGAVLLLPKFAFSSLFKIVLGVSTTVAALGLLQYLLPDDTMAHLGYGIERGARAVFLIDDKPGLMRIMSTLREPNALGAYLILLTTALFAFLLRYKDKTRRYLLWGMLGLHLLALFLTFSRSAWLGTAVALILVVLWQFYGKLGGLLRKFWPLVACLAVLVSAGLFASRDSHFFQQYVIHSNPTEQANDLDSNDYHRLFLEQGLKGIADQPLGHGPGTAGLASIQNPTGSFLTENYYVQIGYELGVLGLALFVGLNIWVYVRLMRQNSQWVIVILASFWGYVLTNMLLHTWSNEAVAAQWWILAGMSLGAAATPLKPKRKT